MLRYSCSRLTELASDAAATGRSLDTALRRGSTFMRYSMTAWRTTGIQRRTVASLSSASFKRFLAASKIFSS